MTNFDLPPVGGFDVARYQQTLQALGRRAGIADSEQEPGAATGSSAAATTGSFEGTLQQSLAGVQSLQDDVRAKTRGLILGEDVELHDVMLAASKSEVAFNLLLEVRNKLVDAWDKLSRSVT